MKGSVTRLYRQAIAAATASVKTIAEESGYSRPTLDLYLNRRPPSRDAVIALADALEGRAARLADYAVRLREAAGEEPAGRPADAKAPARARRRRPARRNGTR